MVEVAEKNIFERRVSRRRFLKGVVKGATALATASLLKESKGPEKLKEIPSNLVMIDFAPQKQSPNFHQDIFPNNNQLAEELSGGEYDYLGIQKELAAGVVRRNVDLIGIYSNAREVRLFYEALKKYPKGTLVYGALRTFGRHGELVAGAMRKTLKQYGYHITPHIIPLQEIINPASVEFTIDELGNRQFFITVEPESIIEMLKKFPDQKVVNFSFQMGKLGFRLTEKEKKLIGPIEYPRGSVMVLGDKVTYSISLPNGEKINVSTEEEYNRLLEESFVKSQEKAFQVIDAKYPGYTAVGAYSRGENNFPNFEKLLKLCGAFPDKLFVCAGGNFRDNILEIREVLKDSWPQNLLVVAEWLQGKGPRDDMKGADIYVNNDALGLPEGSSFSTPVISALASILVNNRLIKEEIKQKLFSFCDTVTYQDYSPEKSRKETTFIDIPANLYNPKKVRFP